MKLNILNTFATVEIDCRLKSEGIDIYTCDKQVLWESGAFFSGRQLSFHAASLTVHAFVV